MASVQDERRLSPYRKLLVELSLELSGSDLETLKFAAVDFVPRGKTENITSGLKLFDVLEQDARITPQDLSLLGDMFKTIGRMDLAWRVQCFETSLKDSNNAGMTSKYHHSVSILFQFLLTIPFLGIFFGLEHEAISITAIRLFVSKRRKSKFAANFLAWKRLRY